MVRRLGEAADLLSPAGIIIFPLDAGQATAVLSAAGNPDSLIPPTAGLAGADEIITSRRSTTAGSAATSPAGSGHQHDAASTVRSA